MIRFFVWFGLNILKLVCFILIDLQSRQKSTIRKKIKVRLSFNQGITFSCLYYITNFSKKYVRLRVKRKTTPTKQENRLF